MAKATTEKDFYEWLDNCGLDDLWTRTAKAIYESLRDNFQSTVPIAKVDKDSLFLTWRNKTHSFELELDSRLDWYWFLINRHTDGWEMGYAHDIKQGFQKYSLTGL